MTIQEVATKCISSDILIYKITRPRKSKEKTFSKKLKWFYKINDHWKWREDYLDILCWGYTTKEEKEKALQEIKEIRKVSQTS
jgi:hypothetical protein